MQGKLLKGSFLGSKMDSCFGDGIGGLPCSQPLFAITDPSDFDLQQATAAIRSCNRLGLWAVLSRGVHMRMVLAEGTARVSPLVLAIQANYQEDPDLEYDLPNTALLWACCSPHDFGLPEVSPLCEALRSGDNMAVSLLLRHGASPSRRRRRKQ